MRHTIKLTMEDNVYDNIMFMLRNLKIKGLKIEEIQEESMKNNTKDKIKKLFSSQNIQPFKSVKDPMQWQKDQRDEW